MEKNNLIKLIVQHLNDNRLSEVSQKLQSESGIYIDQMSDIIEYINTDRYDNILAKVDNNDFNSNIALKVKIYIIFKLIKENQNLEALNFIRTINIDKGLITKLVKLTLVKDEKSILKQMEEISPESVYKERLINYIESAIIPEHLSEVLDNIIKEQIRMCKYHNTSDNRYSYFFDHSCDISNIPNEYIYSLEQHNEEIISIVYSNSCKYFAATLKSNSIAIYKMELAKNTEAKNVQIILYNLINAHKSQITSTSWTPNDKYLITSSKDKTIKIWCPYSGTLKTNIDSNGSMISSLTIIDNYKFISSGLDYKISQYSIYGHLDYSVPLPGLTITEVLYSSIFNYILLVSATTNSILIYNFIDKTEVSSIKLNDVIISCAISKLDKGKYILVNSSKATPAINLIRLEDNIIQRKYFGHRQERFSIKCDFGGQNENFIVSGSEDANIYIWNRNHSMPILSVKAHSAAVNSVIWSHKFLTDCIISCSDDHTIKILTNHFINKVSIDSISTTIENKIVNFDENIEKMKQQM